MPVRHKLQLFVLCFLPSVADAELAVEWTRQIDRARVISPDIAVDQQGNVFVAGHTYGNVGGQSAGSADVVLTKHDRDGTLLWKKQLGTPEFEGRVRVATDLLGNSFITGQTYGNLIGTGPSNIVVGGDVFLSKFDTFGELSWTRQWGANVDVGGFDVAVDDTGDAYVSGTTGTLFDGSDTFLLSVHGSGDSKWVEQFGTSNWDTVSGFTIDKQGKAYVTGHEVGFFGEVVNPFIRVFDADGEAILSLPLDDPRNVVEQPSDLTLDESGDVLLTGTSRAGASFVAKYDSSGVQQWAAQLNANDWTSSNSITVNELGDVFIAGATKSNGFTDMFVAKYASSGDFLWMERFGGERNEYASGIEVDRFGDLYLVGVSDSRTFNGQVNTSGEQAAFLVRLHDVSVPEPSSGATFSIGCFAAVCLIVRRDVLGRRITNRHLASTLVLLAVLLSVVRNVDADLIERDWKQPGDGLLTYDDVHQREWLDLTETINNSVADVSSMLRSGGFLEGFRIATSADVGEFVSSAGLQVDLIDGCAEAGDATKQMIGLAGDTLEGDFGLVGPAGSVLTSLTGQYGEVSFLIGNGICWDLDPNTTTYDETSTFPLRGVWLFRPVPEPDVLCLYSCVALLCILRQWYSGRKDEVG